MSVEKTFNPEIVERRSDFGEPCRIGSGIELRSVQDDAAMRDFLFSGVDISTITNDPNTVFLTPEHTVDPVFLGEGDVYRGWFDFRSFKRVLEGTDGNQYTITVKGGDLLNQDSAQIGFHRMTKGKPAIAGSAIYESVGQEYSNANILQALSQKILGRPTFAPRPISIREIRTVEYEGQQMPARAYIDSPAYLGEKEQHLRSRYHVDWNIADKIYDEWQSPPHEYIYAHQGIDSRVSYHASALFFQEKQGGFGYMSENEDSLSHLEQDGLLCFGDIHQEHGHSQDSIVRAVYGRLAEAYGVDLKGVLPDGEITQENYRNVLPAIVEACETTGIGDVIMTAYIDRLTEVLALAHSHGFTFSSIDQNVGGSFVMRNVTIAGVVLDLDTMNRNANPNLFAKDFNEMLVSLSCLFQILHSSQSFREVYLSRVLEAYHQKVEEFASLSDMSPDIGYRMSEDILNNTTQKIIDFVPKARFISPILG